MTDICYCNQGNQGKPLSEVEAYDVNKDKWTRLLDIPTPHCSCAYIGYRGRLHIIGGLSIGGPSGAMEALGVKQVGQGDTKATAASKNEESSKEKSS